MTASCACLAEVEPPGTVEGVERHVTRRAADFGSTALLFYRQISGFLPIPRCGVSVEIQRPNSQLKILGMPRRTTLVRSHAFDEVCTRLPTGSDASRRRCWGERSGARTSSTPLGI